MIDSNLFKLRTYLRLSFTMSFMVRCTRRFASRDFKVTKWTLLNYCYVQSSRVRLKNLKLGMDARAGRQYECTVLRATTSFGSVGSKCVYFVGADIPVDPCPCSGIPGRVANLCNELSIAALSRVFSILRRKRDKAGKTRATKTHRIDLRVSNLTLT